MGEAQVKILVVQVHTPFFYTLSMVGHEWWFVPASYTMAWGPERPMPKNCHAITWKEARKKLKQGFFDLYILSTEEQWQLNREDLPTLYIEHNPTLVKKIHHVDDPTVPVVWNPISNATWKKRKNGTYIVYPPYLAFSPLKYKGIDPTIIQVCKGFAKRPLATGIDVWNIVTKGLPKKLAGRFNEDLDGNIGYQDYKQIRSLYANSRVYFDTKIHWYSSAVQEAMYTGMPIVTIDTNIPFKNEEECIVGTKDTYLRKWLQRLLKEPELAREIGAKGRKAYYNKYRFEPYKMVWKRALRRAVELYNDKIEDLQSYPTLDRLLKDELEDVFA